MDQWRDVRLVCRHLLRSPGYTVAAVLTLALAIGANSAIFSAVYAVLLKPLPIREPGRLVVGWESDAPRNLAVLEVTYRNYERWRDGSRSFAQMAAMGSSAWPAVLEGDEGATKLASMGVTASFFDTLGAPALHGRVLRPEDEQPGVPPVVVLSHSLWARRFGANPAVVGTMMRLSGGPVRIVGVMPPGFDFPRGTSFWKPVYQTLANASKAWGGDAFEAVGVLFVVARLRDGVAREAATQELDAIARRVPNAPVRPAGVAAVTVTPFQDYVVGPVRGALWWLLAAVAALLLVACANVSGLMLTRAALRRREQAIRLALGATHTTLGRLWTIESLLLALAGGALGLGVAQGMISAIVALAPEDVPHLADVAINRPVALFTFGAVFVTALLCGVGPILQARAANLAEALNDAARGSSGAHSLRARSMLVTLQIGLAVVLLVSAGLIVRSFTTLRQLDLGFDPGDVVTIDIHPPGDKVSPNEWLRDLLAHVETMPGVSAAGAVSLRPLALGAVGQETWVVLEGQPDTDATHKANPALNYEVATPGYFRAMRIPLVRGRLFEASDSTDVEASGSPRVAILGESAARRLFAGRDPIGRRIALPSLGGKKSAASTWRTVIGVVRDVRYRGLDDVRLDVYEPALPSTSTVGHVMIRTDGNPVALGAAVQAEARRRDPRAIVDGITTMEAIVSRAMAPWRFSMWTFTLFAGLAFLLATVGLVGVVSLDVVHRSREFAVRLALGAERRDIFRRVLRAAGGRLLAGVGLGLLVATATSQAIRSLLFGVQPLDASTYVVVVLLVALVVAAATYLPARRAARIDPLVLLRRD